MRLYRDITFTPWSFAILYFLMCSGSTRAPETGKLRSILGCFKLSINRIFSYLPCSCSSFWFVHTFFPVGYYLCTMPLQTRTIFNTFNKQQWPEHNEIKTAQNTKPSKNSIKIWFLSNKCACSFCNKSFVSCNLWSCFIFVWISVYHYC